MQITLSGTTSVVCLGNKAADHIEADLVRLPAGPCAGGGYRVVARLPAEAGTP